MDDASGMGRVERIGDLHSHLDEIVRGKQSLRDALLDCLPFKVFHRDERLPFMLFERVDRTDVRMVQGGRGPALPSKTLQRLLVPGAGFGKELQGHWAVQPGILGFVQHPHPTCPQFAQDAIVADHLSNL